MVMPKSSTKLSNADELQMKVREQEGSYMLDTGELTWNSSRCREGLLRGAGEESQEKSWAM